MPADQQNDQPREAGSFAQRWCDSRPTAHHSTCAFPSAGLERLHFAALGRYPDHGSATFLRPRLITAAGEVVELELSNTSDTEAVQAGRVAATEMEVQGEMWKGFSLQLGEISFPLTDQHVRFEVDVVYQPETALPPYAAIDCQPISERADQYNRVQEALWDSVARDFRDRQSQIEMEMERQDGIWNEYAPILPGDMEAYYRTKAIDRARLGSSHIGTRRAVRAAAGLVRGPEGDSPLSLTRLCRRHCRPAAARPVRRTPGTYSPALWTCAAGFSSRIPRWNSIAC